MSGAGSAIIMVPVWLTMGYPLPAAIASNKVNGALWTPLAARNYLKGRYFDRWLTVGLTCTGLIGAYYGTRAILFWDPRMLQSVFGGIILCLVAYSFMRKEFGLTTSAPRLGKWVTSLFGIPLGFYEAFFGSGNGLFTAAILTKCRGFDLLTALGYYYVMAFAWCAFAAVLFIWRGYGFLDLMVPSSVGSLLGAHFGSRIGVRKGAAFVKTLFMVLGGVLGLKLLLAF